MAASASPTGRRLVRRHFDPTLWPEADRRAWEAALAADADFGSRTSQWADTTKRSIAAAYGRWLNWCASNGRLQAADLAARVTPEAVTAYVTDLRTEVTSVTVAVYMSGLCRVLEVMAPTHDWRWLRKRVNRLHKVARPSRNKRQRVVPSSDLFDLGLELMDQADAATDGMAVDVARQYRDGLLIALMAARPLRRANFAAMQIGKQLLKERHGYTLLFEPGETKTQAPIELPFPDRLVLYLERYLAHHREVLCWAAGPPGATTNCTEFRDDLWVSQSGTGITPRTIHHVVKKRTSAAYKLGLGPHLFRDCAATTIATEDPDHVRITMSVLGHSRMRTSEDAYNHAQSIKAAGMYQAHMLKLRKSHLKRCSKVGQAPRGRR